MKKILNIFCTIKAFSLIELMISLITISCIVAAFTPVITKKMKNSNVTISGNNVSDITTECTDKFSSNCKLCTKSYCIQCELNSCPIGQYAENKSCSCKDCSTLHSNCLECDSTKCTKCKDNNYYINNGKCETCPTNKICDGINAYDESYCTNPPTGYYCDGNNIKRCIDKYGMYCATCNSSSCLTCSAEYFFDGTTCSHCPPACGYCKNSTQCITCYPNHFVDSSYKCILCDTYMPNCFYCSSANTCTKCYGGYYVNSSNNCSPCSDIANCADCLNSSICTMCKKGYYANSSGKCSLCSIANCALCNKDGTCVSCNQGYYLSDDKKSCIKNDGFFCSDSNFMQIGNLCFTRKNMGDSSMLPIPSTVSVAKINSDYCNSSKSKCCWSGQSNLEVCDSSNGDYSGCGRTLCNFNAAKEICSKFNYGGKIWRLPTADELNNIKIYSINLGNNGLMLCDTVGGYGSSFCGSNSLCKGGVGNTCAYHYVWTSTVFDSLNYISYGLNAGAEGAGPLTILGTASVRCVTEIE